jgi:hypothetical protein
MTLTATAAIKASEVSENNQETKKVFIHKSNLKKCFAQAPNWLFHRMARKGRIIENRSWAILGYICSLPPDTEVDVNLLVENLGHKERTIYECIAYLKRMKHVCVRKIRDKMGRVIKAEYHFFMNRNGWEKNDIFLNQVRRKLQEDDIKRKNRNSKFNAFNENKQLGDQDEIINLQEDDIRRLLLRARIL